MQQVQASINRARLMEGGGGLDKHGDGFNDDMVNFTYHAERVLGSGSFGVVYEAKVMETGETVAIKKVLQDKRFKNRELQIMKELRHCNTVELIHAFHTPGEKPAESYLHVVMEYCSQTVHHVMKHYAKMRQQVPYIYVQLYTYQMLRGVAYMHATGICHRDIKPQNLLVDGHTHSLKVCDFGSAKRLSKEEPNVAYICSRFYRAPELIFGATDYGTIIDVWAVGCVAAEFILGQVLFPGKSGIDQLMEIIKILGTPTREDLSAMNPNYQEFRFPQIRSQAWHKVLRSKTTPEATDWISKLLQYNPSARPTGLQGCTHPLFDDLRDKDTRICSSKPVSDLKDQGSRGGSSKPLPEHLFWFSQEEMALMDEEMRKKLIPDWVTVEQGGAWPPKGLGSKAARQRGAGPK